MTESSVKFRSSREGTGLRLSPRGSLARAGGMGEPQQWEASREPLSLQICILIFELGLMGHGKLHGTGSETMDFTAAQD